MLTDETIPLSPLLRSLPRFRSQSHSSVPGSVYEIVEPGCRSESDLLPGSDLRRRKLLRLFRGIMTGAPLLSLYAINAPARHRYLSQVLSDE